MREHYDFEDRNGIKLGEVDGNFFQLPAKFVVKDTNGLELMHINGKNISLRNQFSFYDNSGQVLGTIRKKMVKLIGHQYWVERDGGKYMRIYGNYFGHDFQMQVNGIEVATIHKKWFSIRDQLGLSIIREVDHRVVLGALIAIAHLEVTQRQKSH